MSASDPNVGLKINPKLGSARGDRIPIVQFDVTNRLAVYRRAVCAAKIIEFARVASGADLEMRGGHLVIGRKSDGCGCATDGDHLPAGEPDLAVLRSRGCGNQDDPHGMSRGVGEW